MDLSSKLEVRQPNLLRREHGAGVRTLCAEVTPTRASYCAKLGHRATSWPASVCIRGEMFIRPFGRDWGGYRKVMKADLDAVH